MRLSRLIYNTFWEDLPRVLWWGRYRTGLTYDRADAERHASPSNSPHSLNAEAAARLLDARRPELPLSERRYPLLTHLVRLALTSAEPLCVFDFGGSVGTHYAEARRLLDDERIESWTVCELPGIVSVGEAEAARRGWTRLRFTTRTDALAGADVAIAFGVMQIAAAGEEFLRGLARAQRRPRHVLLGNMEITDGPTFYSVQRSPRSIPYMRGHVLTSYNRQELVGRLTALGYRIADVWDGPTHRPVVFRRETVTSTGYLFELS